MIAKDKYKKAKKGKTRDGPDGVFTVGYGAGGIEEMQKYLPSTDDMVLFGLLDFKIGTGTFSRHKLIRMHFNGEKCKNVLKGRINSERKKAERVIAHVNGDFQICHAEECHTETVRTIHTYIHTYTKTQTHKHTLHRYSKRSHITLPLITLLEKTL